jgi:hypothetical protein
MTLRRGQRPDPKDEAAKLSDDDVERRLGGDAGLGGPVAERVPPPPPPTPPGPPTIALAGAAGGGRRGGVLWRDVGLVLVLLAFLAIGARVVLPDSSTASATPTPGASLVAVASPSVAPTALPTPPASPSPTPPALPSDVIPSLPPEATPTPAATSSPTPTPTPRTTAQPTPHPTATPVPQTATVTVSFLMKNLFGGNDVPASWTVHVTGAGASPASFLGTSAGTPVRVNAGQAYSITTTASTPGGYSQLLSADCAGALPASQSAQCTITETDIEPKLQVFVSGLPDASVTTVSVAGANPSSSSFPGSASGTSLRVESNASYAISASAVDGYSQSSRYGTCIGPLREGASVQCILYFTSTAAAAPGSPASAIAVPPLGLLLPLASLGPRAFGPRRAARRLAVRRRRPVGGPPHR